MLSHSESIQVAEQAGKALQSGAWQERKEAKRELSAKCRENSHWKKPNSTVKLNRQIRNTGSSIAQGVDAAVDRFVERVEKILRREGGIDELLERLDEVMPAEAPEAK